LTPALALTAFLLIPAIAIVPVAFGVYLGEKPGRFVGGVAALALVVTAGLLSVFDSGPGIEVVAPSGWNLLRGDEGQALALLAFETTPLRRLGAILIAAVVAVSLLGAGAKSQPAVLALGGIAGVRMMAVDPKFAALLDVATCLLFWSAATGLSPEMRWLSAAATGVAGVALEAGPGAVGAWGWWSAAIVRFGIAPFHGTWTAAWGGARAANAWLPLQAAALFRAAIAAPEFPAAPIQAWILLVAFVALPLLLAFGEANAGKRAAKLLAASMPAPLLVAAAQQPGLSMLAIGAALSGASLLAVGPPEAWARLVASGWWCGFFAALLAALRETGAAKWGVVAAALFAAAFAALLFGAPAGGGDEGREADLRRRTAGAIAVAGLAFAIWRLRAGG
jgi:hypothetical protein